MADTFSSGWRVQYGSSYVEQPRVFQAGFGDGYIQRATEGITPILKEWNVSFYNEYEITRKIIAFLEQHKGTTFFYWVDPLGDQGKYITSSWNVSFPSYRWGLVETSFVEVVDNG